MGNWKRPPEPWGWSWESRKVLGGGVPGSLLLGMGTWTEMGHSRGGGWHRIRQCLDVPAPLHKHSLEWGCLGTLSPHGAAPKPAHL